MGYGAGRNSSVCAVVVTYNPPPAVLENLALLAAQLGETIIVDNTAQTSAPDLLSNLDSNPKFTVIRNRENLGIARALNIGIQHGMEKGYAWVATFDQDSSVTPQFFSGLLEAYENCPYKSRVALVAPVLAVSEQVVAEMRKQPSRELFTDTLTAMTSGSLIRADVFRKEGPYDESFFMDYVDYDYCLKLHRLRWKIIRAGNVYLVHRLGAAETHSFLGFRVTIKSHTPWRRYHIMRNRIMIYRRYAFSSPGWCLYDFVWIFIEMTKIVLFEKEKRAKFWNIFKGAADGLSRKMGQWKQERAPT